MGSRGPLGQNKSTLSARGSWRGKNPAAGGNPLFPPMHATPPDGLDGVARETWESIVPPLIADGTLRAVDRNVVEAYCRTLADCVQLREILRTEGTVIKGRSGVPKQHPAWRLLNRSESMLLVLARELGISPASRGRIVREPAKPADNAMMKLVRVK